MEGSNAARGFTITRIISCAVMELSTQLIHIVSRPAVDHIFTARNIIYVAMVFSGQFQPIPNHNAVDLTPTTRPNQCVVMDMCIQL